MKINLKITAIHFFLMMAIFNLLTPDAHAQQTDPILSDYKRNSWGRVVEINLEEARNYCYYGTPHRELPTARDLARYAQIFGAADILETAYSGVSADSTLVRAEIMQKRTLGYHPIYTENQAHQNAVDFYYSKGAYLPPRGFRVTFSIWSQSTYGIYTGLVYILDFGSGDIYYNDSGILAAVRCKL